MMQTIIKHLWRCALVALCMQGWNVWADCTTQGTTKTCSVDVPVSYTYSGKMIAGLPKFDTTLGTLNSARISGLFTVTFFHFWEQMSPYLPVSWSPFYGFPIPPNTYALYAPVTGVHYVELFGANVSSLNFDIKQVQTIPYPEGMYDGVADSAGPSGRSWQTNPGDISIDLVAPNSNTPPVVTLADFTGTGDIPIRIKPGPSSMGCYANSSATSCGWGSRYTATLTVEYNFTPPPPLRIPILSN
jgi:hypothetical protein